MPDPVAWGRIRSCTTTNCSKPLCWPDARTGGNDFRFLLQGSDGTPLRVASVQISNQPYPDEKFLYAISQPWLQPYTGPVSDFTTTKHAFRQGDGGLPGLVRYAQRSGGRGMEALGPFLQHRAFADGDHHRHVGPGSMNTAPRISIRPVRWFTNRTGARPTSFPRGIPSPSNATSAGCASTISTARIYSDSSPGAPVGTTAHPSLC